MHEHIQKHTANLKGSTNRTFGFVFATFFALIGIYPLINGQDVRIWSLLCAGILLLFALFIPNVLAPINKVWAQFGVLLHRITSPIILGALFYLIVTPTGLLIRLLGKDPLRLRLDPSADSYWIKRDPPGPSADSLNKQF